MPFVTATDGTRLAYEDYGDGRPIVLVAGWSLGAEMWEYQVPFFLDHGYRCVLPERRGHGRSDRPTRGYDIDTRVDDLAAVLDLLDLRSATLVGHSSGAAEVAHYLDRHGTRRVAAVAFVRRNALAATNATAPGYRLRGAPTGPARGDGGAPPRTGMPVRPIEAEGPGRLTR